MSDPQQSRRQLSRRTMLSTAATVTVAAALGRGPVMAALATPPASTPVPVSALGQTPLGERLAWLIALLNAGADAVDPADVEAHVTPSFLAVIPAEQLGGYLQQITEAFGTLEAQGLTRPPTETQAVALLMGSTGAQMALPVSVEAEAPHRITGTNFYPLPTADGAPLAAMDEAGTDEERSGGLVDIGGRKLYLAGSGQDGPTVVLDAGLGDSAAGWAAIEAAVATFARVCSYDRANVFAGASDPAPTPRTAKDVVDDLHALLMAASVPRPYVLVGHSFGGLAARFFASRYPDEVAGLVLVDASHEEQFERLAPFLSEEQLAFMDQVLSANPEGIDLATSNAEMRQARETTPLKEMPLFVLTAGHSADAASLPPDWPIAEDEALWNELQADLAGLVPGGRRVVAEESGHYIHQAQPGLVIEAIQAVVEAVRDPGTWATPTGGTPAT